MTAVRRRHSAAGETNVEIPPPSSELLGAAEAVCKAAVELSELKQRIRSSEQHYRTKKAAAADAQQRHDRSQGLVGLGELVREVSATRLALERAEAELCAAQQLLPAAEAKVAELDARHRTMACELIKPLRASAARCYRRAAQDLKNARDFYLDVGAILGEHDGHASGVVLWDLESHTDLLYQPNRPATPTLARYQIIRKALAEGRRR
jgi:hypothetical protein